MDNSVIESWVLGVPALAVAAAAATYEGVRVKLG
jgi:hypothetical protein